MILLDANLLVYAHARESPHHEPARAWFEEVMNAPDRVGIPWPTLLAFVRLMGNPNVVRRPVPLREAWARAERWLAQPQAWIPLPTERHQAIFSELLRGETRHDVANDAHLAALAVEHGLTVCSTDRDFSRFEPIRWMNPLTPR
ncbi:MAG: type II toxin-antitoxin system VapC family toxin [Actinobacteria bacterium]|nr:type II toxin-antitoxin system VapC family toxin [Actinomycetota bacterium]